jgi:predicted amidohydrolase
MDVLRLGLVQYDPVWCDPEASLARVVELLETSPPTDLLVLPEMSFTGFTMETDRSTLAEEFRAKVAELARRRETGIVYGGVEDGFNRASLLDREGRRIGTYDKRHLFSLGHEPHHYRPGPPPLDWEFEGWRIRPAICYDLRFPYHFWNGAEDYQLIIVPACWPGSRERHWKTLLAARAIENQSWIAGCNRIGAEPRLTYSGGSSVLDPSGQPVALAEDREEVLVTEIRMDLLESTRSRFRFLSDRL